MIIKDQTNHSSSQEMAHITMYYDDTCILCSTEAYSMQTRNPKGITLTSVDQGIDELQVAGFSRVDAMTYLCVKDDSGNWHTHMDAVRLLYKVGSVKGAALLYLPVVKQLGDFVYPYVARNRYRIPNWVTKLVYGKAVGQACENGICSIAPDKR